MGVLHTQTEEMPCHSTHYVEYVTSTKGKPLVLYLGYTYNMKKISGRLTTWTCSTHHRKGCSASIDGTGFGVDSRVAERIPESKKEESTVQFGASGTTSEWARDGWDCDEGVSCTGRTRKGRDHRDKEIDKE
ncbi:hypothetical protein evm_014893 [Chilo suppressalis]|nr:hypothetical protein evm_014893 [Chilo suppressalis]